ncbi:MAG: hypothetical protein MUQ10_01250, partial [Anaerolineae bacterium]|nr:hypothetical protein [Anaerolineae bacterium]
MRHLRRGYVMIMIGLLLAGCRNPLAPSEGKVSPTPAAVSATDATSATATIITPATETVPVAVSPIPTILSSPLAQPDSWPAAADILQAVYGEALYGDTENGYRIGEVTVPWVGPATAGSFTSA